jgi:proteasome lid subunit RPN8/RPN11
MTEIDKHEEEKLITDAINVLKEKLSSKGLDYAISELEDQYDDVGTSNYSDSLFVENNVEGFVIDDNWTTPKANNISYYDSWDDYSKNFEEPSNIKVIQPVAPIKKYRTPPSNFIKVNSKNQHSRQLPIFSITFSKKAYSQIILMMIDYPKIEWGAFFTVPNMPTLNQLKEYYKENRVKDTKNKVIYEVEIKELIVYPQTTNGVEVEYSPDYNNLMDDYKRVRKEGNFPLGIIHSHHTMTAYHSNTDRFFLEERLAMRQKTISIVLASKLPNVNVMKKIISGEISDKKLEKLIEQFTTDYEIVYPPTDKMLAKNKIGFSFENEEFYYQNISSNDIATNKEFVNRYEIMINSVKKLSPFLKSLESFKNNFTISEPHFHKLKKNIFNSKEAQNVYTIAEEYISQLEKSLEQMKRIDYIINAD